MRPCAPSSFREHPLGSQQSAKATPARLVAAAGPAGCANVRAIRELCKWAARATRHLGKIAGYALACCAPFQPAFGWLKPAVAPASLLRLRWARARRLPTQPFGAGRCRRRRRLVWPQRSLCKQATAARFKRAWLAASAALAEGNEWQRWPLFGRLAMTASFSIARLKPGKKG